MQVAAPITTLDLRANAKVNLHLGVYPGRDEAGYHRTDSAMICLELADSVRVALSDTPSVEFIPNLSIDVTKSVVYRAIVAFERTYAPGCSFSATIKRNVPGSGGLGSSSADAATVLVGMALLSGVPLEDPQLFAIAADLGTDVPFFLDTRPALFTGTGNHLERSFEHVSMPLVVVKPEAGVSTPRAYAAFDANPSEPVSPDAMSAALAEGNIPAIAAALYNNLADAACTLAPEAGECVAWLKEQDGVLGAQVTGSGSCSFAICESDDAASRIAQASPWWACATRTLG